mmetsp:Transcript_1088/g.2371  ORF Transcript_1088/g.2371 Transcript_1088/m.2371 type:complete len:222 (-) Transcript_1088:40-705(-)
MVSSKSTCSRFVGRSTQVCFGGAPCPFCSVLRLSSPRLPPKTSQSCKASFSSSTAKHLPPVLSCNVVGSQLHLVVVSAQGQSMKVSETARKHSTGLGLATGSCVSKVTSSSSRLLTSETSPPVISTASIPSKLSLCGESVEPIQATPSPSRQFFKTTSRPDTARHFVASVAETMVSAPWTARPPAASAPEKEAAMAAAIATAVVLGPTIKWTPPSCFTCVQ